MHGDNSSGVPCIASSNQASTHPLLYGFNLGQIGQSVDAQTVLPQLPHHRLAVTGETVLPSGNIVKPDVRPRGVDHSATGLMHHSTQLSRGYDDMRPTTCVDGDFGVEPCANSVDVTDLIAQILGSNPKGVAEGLSDQSSISWGASQIVNDALAAFQADV